jgi:hypothetical protein
MNVSNTGLIKPFNLDPAEYAVMFNTKLPDHIVMTINVLKAELKCPDCAREYIDHRKQKLKSTMLEFTNRAVEFGISSMIAPVLLSDSGFDGLWSQFAAKQDAWQIEDGLYVQVAFYDFDLIGNRGPRREVAYPMTFLDTLVCRTGSVDPASHKASVVFSEIAKAYEKIVGNTYRNRIGIWSKDLVEFRNMVLVQARAVLTDRDPVAEYDRFIQAGGWYFLEYPALCP